MQFNRDSYFQTTLLPTNQWGTEFPLVPFMRVKQNEFQFVADTDGTTVDVNGEQHILNAGQYESLFVSDATMLRSNFPIQLIQIGQVLAEKIDRKS